ncbi:MAG: type II and III secretion system protein [Acidobacteria bacterium]|nr:MAG: type II and III secretion system protein [Acidobacteriota bacterium]
MRRKLYALFLSVALLVTAGSVVYGQNAAAPTPAVFTVGASQQQEAPQQLRVQAGRSLVINSGETLQRVSVTDPTIATAIIVAPNQVLIHGVLPGTVTLILWDDQNRTRTFNLTVEIDVNTLSQTLSQVFPGENIRVAQSGGSVVLSGNTSSKDIADRAAALAASQAKSVVNLLLQVPGRQAVMLQVRFAEVDRSAVQQLGMNLFSTGALNTTGVISTQRFGAISGGSVGNSAAGPSSSFNLSDLLNLMVFRPDINLGVTIRALEQKSLLQILAEPNVMALDGVQASFLAGGEFPFPVVQGSGGLQSVTIQFKEFGVRLNFTPQIMSDGAIRLKVAPEVSALDFTNALTVSGFLVPALSTRRAQTEVELRDGQSFAIAGLIDNRLTQIGEKIPVLSSIPIIGNFFKSRSTSRSNTELLVMVTPRIVRPVEPSALPSGPEFPKPFLDREKFDGPAGETPAKRGALLPADGIHSETRAAR